MILSQATVKYGLIAGIGTIAYFLLFYIINKTLLFNPFVYWTSLGFYLAFMWSAVQIEIQDKGEKPGFQASLSTAFRVFVIASFIYYLFYYLLFGLIDPGLIDLQREVMIESLEQSGTLLDEEQVEAMQESIKGDQLNPTIGKVFFTFVRGLLGGFLFALGMAALANRGR